MKQNLQKLQSHLKDRNLKEIKAIIFDNSINFTDPLWKKIAIDVFKTCNQDIIYFLVEANIPLDLDDAERRALLEDKEIQSSLKNTSNNFTLIFQALVDSMPIINELDITEKQNIDPSEALIKFRNFIRNARASLIELLIHRYRNDEKIIYEIFDELYVRSKYDPTTKELCSDLKAELFEEETFLYKVIELGLSKTLDCAITELSKPLECEIKNSRKPIPYLIEHTAKKLDFIHSERAKDILTILFKQFSKPYLPKGPTDYSIMACALTTIINKKKIEYFHFFIEDFERYKDYLDRDKSNFFIGVTNASMAMSDINSSSSSLKTSTEHEGTRDSKVTSLSLFDTSHTSKLKSSSSGFKPLVLKNIDDGHKW